MIKRNITLAIPGNKDAWLERICAAWSVMELRYPAKPLNIAHGNYIRNSRSNTDYKPDRSIDDRKKYLRERIKRSSRDFSVYNSQDPNFMLSGQFYTSTSIYNLYIQFCADGWQEFEEVLVSIADICGAYNAIVMPPEAARLTHWFNGAHVLPEEELKLAKFRADLSNIQRELPVTNQHIGIRHHPAQPIALGWLNYWSAETCSYLEFPDPVRDRDLLAHSYSTPGGAWLVKLSADPLDFDHPEHLEIFADVYARFPKLGLRVVKKADEPPSFIYPEHTTYIQDGKLLHVFENIVSFFRSHGYQILDRPPQKASADNIVTIGLISGETNWTVIKTLPSDFLAKPIPGKEEPMLFELCRKNQCAGFLLSIYNECEALLLEAAADGRTCQSGIQDFEGLPDDVDFEAMDESGNPPVIGFRLLSIGIDTDIGNIDDYVQIAGQLHDLLVGKNADLCGDKNFVEAVTSNVWQNRQGVRLFLIPAQPE